MQEHAKHIAPMDAIYFLRSICKKHLFISFPETEKQAKVSSSLPNNFDDDFRYRLEGD